MDIFIKIVPSNSLKLGICSEDGTGEDRVHFLQSGDTGKRSEVSDKKRISGKKDTAGGNVCVYLSC